MPLDIFSSSTDLMRLVFILGAILAFVYKKRMGVTPGGIIVPGILAGVLLTSFTAFLISVVSTAICWSAFKLFVSKYALSHRWKLLVCLSISVVTGLILVTLAKSYQVIDQGTMLLTLLAPGLITVAAKKYGLYKTLSATAIVTAITGTIGLLLANTIPYQLLTSLTVQLAVYTPLYLTHPFIVLPISLITAVLIYYRFGIRGGGYMIAPYLAVVMSSSIVQAVLLLAGVGVSYLMVKLIQKYSMIIGLERFVLSLLCGYFVVTVIDHLAISLGVNGYRPSQVILIIAIAVMTNDLCLQPLRISLKKGIAPSFLISYLTRLAV